MLIEFKDFVDNFYHNEYKIQINSYLCNARVIQLSWPEVEILQPQSSVVNVKKILFSQTN